VFFHQKLAR